MFHSVLPNFLLLEFIIHDKGVLKSPATAVESVSPCILSALTLYILPLFCCAHTPKRLLCLPGDGPVCHHAVSFFIAGVFLGLKSLFINHVPMPAVLWLLLAWFIFLRPFTFHLSTYLKWVSCGQHISKCDF